MSPCFLVCCHGNAGCICGTNTHQQPVLNTTPPLVLQVRAGTCRPSDSRAACGRWRSERSATVKIIFVLIGQNKHCEGWGSVSTRTANAKSWCTHYALRSWHMIQYLSTTCQLQTVILKQLMLYMASDSWSYMTVEQFDWLAQSH